MKGDVKVARSVISLFAVLIVASVSGAAAAAAVTSNGDRAISQAGTLVLDDFPSGWASSPQTSTTDSDKLADGIAACKALSAARKQARKTGTRAESNDFKHSGETYSNTVVVLPTAESAAKVFTAYSDTKGQQCLQSVAKKAGLASVAKSSTRVKDPKVTATLSQVSGPSIADGTARFRLELGVTASNLPIAQKAYLEDVIVQNGRSVVAYQYSTEFEQSDNHFLDQLIDASQRRLTAALNGQPAPDPSTPAALGTAQTAGDGAVVTIFSVTPSVPGRFGTGPFTVVDAQICAQKGASATLDASSFGIRLAYADNTSARETFGGPDPQFNSASLNDGACTRGNVAFSPTSSAALTKVVYDPGSTDSKPLAWATG